MVVMGTNRWSPFTMYYLISKWLAHSKQFHYTHSLCKCHFCLWLSYSCPNLGVWNMNLHLSTAWHWVTDRWNSSKFQIFCMIFQLRFSCNWSWWCSWSGFAWVCLLVLAAVVCFFNGECMGEGYMGGWWAYQRKILLGLFTLASASYFP